MASLNAINSKLKSLVISSGFDKLSQQTDIAASAIQALNSSSLGALLGENISGIQSLTTNLDPRRGAGLLTENLTGLQDLVVNDVSSSKSNLDAITGSSINNGFTDLVFAATTAEGIKSAIGAIAPGASTAQLTTILSNVIPSKFAGQVADITVKDFGSFSVDLSSASSVFSSAFSNVVGGLTGNILQDILLETDATPISIITNLGILRSDAGEVLNLLQGKKFDEAVLFVASKTKLAGTFIETILATVPTNLSAQLESTGIAPSSTGVYDVLSKSNEWNGSSTPDTFFDVIATQEHLLIEMIKSSREITEVVFYGHEMSEDQVLTASDIHDAYNDAGDDGIPFHYVILPNGNLQRGRPLSKLGAYSATHANYSIGVVVPHETGNPATVKQGQTATQFIEAFYAVWPGGQCFDAWADMDDESSVPVGINIGNIVASFRKINHGQSNRSFSTRQLISATQGNL